MSLNFDRVAAEYDATRGGERRGAHIATDLEPLLPGGGKVLEVGVGTGVIAKALLERAHDIVGVDISPAMLLRARRRLGGRVAVADASRLPIPDASLAGAYAVWVMHAVADQTAVIRELARAVMPGGRIVVCNNRPPEPDAIEDIVNPMLRRLKSGPRERHDLDALAQVATASGFLARGTVTGAPLEFTERPTDVAAVMARRSHSTLWSVSDEQWRDVVEPAIAGVRALGSEPLRRVKRERYLLLDRR